jgi:hypothetical protein
MPFLFVVILALLILWLVRRRLGRARAPAA